MKVFVSYCSEDRPSVQEYVSFLKDRSGVDVFWDQDIRPPQNWLAVLANNVTESSLLVVFLSRSAIESKFVNREVLMFDGKEGALIYPVYLEDVEEQLPSYSLGLLLNEIQAIFAYKMSFEDACIALADALPKPKPQHESPVIISVMGVKGGTGKGTTVAAMSELIASTGNSVLVIDADLETGGFTKDYGIRAQRQANVWSMLDAAYDKSRPGQEGRKKDLGVWDITPPYLHKEGFGRVYLVPGRLSHDERIGYDALANIPEEQRNSSTLAILEEACARREQASNDIGCILIDCGAENNPLVSAGFVLANYGYIVASPNTGRASDIHRWNAMHKKRYPDHIFETMHVVVNQAQPSTSEDWASIPGVSFVPENPELREIAARGTYDFELIGLNRFFLAVLDVLQKTFSSEHQLLLPDEVDIWLRPWIKQIVEKKVPQNLLKSSSFRISRFMGIALPVLGTILVVCCGIINLTLAQRLEPYDTVRLSIIQVDDRQKAERLKQEILDGADFASLAKKNSLHRTTRDRGGELPQSLRIDDPIPGIGPLPGLDKFLQREKAGSVSPNVFASEGKFYLVKIKGKTTNTPSISWSQNAAQLAAAIGILFGISLDVGGIWWHLRMRRRRRLLLEIIAKGEDRDYLEHLLRYAPEKGALPWLKSILESARDSEIKASLR